MKTLLFTIISLLALPAWASDDCPSFNLKAPGRSMEHVKLPSQIFATCYAHTVAQALDAHRFSTDKPDKMWADPLWLAIFHTIRMEQQKNPIKRILENESLPFSKTNHATFEYGGDLEFIEYMKGRGYCTNKSSGRSVFYRLGLTDETIIGKVLKLTDIHTKFLQDRNEDDLRSTVTNLIKFEPNGKINSRANPKDIEGIIEHIKSVNTKVSKIILAMGILQIDCTKYNVDTRIVIEKGRHFIQTQDEMIEWINSQVETSKNLQPVLVSYCYAGLINNEDRLQEGAKAYPENCASHTSLVIGARKRENKCEYLLRNNWACNPNIKTMKCDKTGDAWVSRELLLNNTARVGGIVE